MSERTNANNDPETLARLLSEQSVVCMNDEPNLSEQDVTDLKNILRGKKFSDSEIDTKQALTLLSYAEPSAELAEIFSNILSNDRKSTKVRITAAVGLSRLGSAASEEALIENLDTDDPIVKSQVIESLGKIGSDKSIGRLEKAAKSANDRDRKLISIARQTIAFREGRDDIDSMPDINWQTQSLKLLADDKVAERVKNIRGSTYGVKLNREVGLSITCGELSLSVLLNNFLERGSWVEKLRSEPMIAGVLTAKEHKSELQTIRYLILTKPTDSGFTISANRTTGDVAFVGEATPHEDDGLRLTMRDVGAERVPAEINGIITDDNIELDLRTWSGGVQSKRYGKAVRIRG